MLSELFSLVAPQGVMWVILPALMAWVAGVEILLQGLFGGRA